MVEMESRLRDWLLRPRQSRHSTAVTGGALASAVGKGHSENQDRGVVAALPAGAMVAALADGMGGMADGADCAARALAAFIAALAELTQTGEPVDERALVAAMRHGNDAVYSAHGGAGGTTLTGLFAAAGSVFMAHAGDTRLYALESNHVRLLSDDDTALAALPAAQAARLSAGERMLRSTQLRRAVGIESDLSPTVRRVCGERFLLTSDGLHDFATVRLNAFAGEEQNPAAAVQGLLAAAAAGGTHDDATAILVAPRRLCALAPQVPRLWDCYGAM